MARFKVTLKVRLILYYRGKILLLKQTKPNGGNYTLVGGTIEQGESAKAWVIRESFEEAGLIIREEDLKMVHVLHKMARKEQRMVLYFKAYRWEGELKAKERHKFKKAEWFYLDKLPYNITPTVKQVLDEYRHGNLHSVIITEPKVRDA